MHAMRAACGCETYRDLRRLKRARMRPAFYLTIIGCVCPAPVSHKYTYHVPWNGAPSALLASVPDLFRSRTFRYAL
jgi:hypothetical protein